MINKNEFLKMVQDNMVNNDIDKPSIKYLGDTLNAFSDVIRDIISKNEQVRFGNIGTFSGIERAARTARNPSTGGTIEVPARSGYPKFKFSKTAKDDSKSED